MYLNLLFTLPLLVTGLAVGKPGTHALVKRQWEGKGNGLSAYPIKAAMSQAAVAPMTPIPGAKRLRLVYGPLALRGSKEAEATGNAPSMDHLGTGFNFRGGDDFPKNITLLEIRMQTQIEPGKLATVNDGIYHHHSVLFDWYDDPIRNVLQCDNKKEAPLEGSAIIGGGAHEEGSFRYWSTDPKIRTGHFLEPTANVVFNTDIVNYKATHQNVYMEVDVEYLEGFPEGYLDTHQIRIEPGVCGGPNGYDVHPPPNVNKFSVGSQNIIMDQDGYLLRLHAHMHNGGVNVVFKVNGKQYCDSRPTYSRPDASKPAAFDEVITSTSECVDPIRVRKGDKIEMIANYDTDMHPVRPLSSGGGMSGMKKRWLASKFRKREEAEQMALISAFFAKGKA